MLAKQTFIISTMVLFYPKLSAKTRFARASNACTANDLNFSYLFGFVIGRSLIRRVKRKGVVSFELLYCLPPSSTS
ncbi:hypothetical protein F5890DRAFT_1149891 [Lentinula detonsa]|uniref:Uncharacterized protein n=1 Tax=Lentinula detonsa TaxID=2804962 RepID=A0AA38UST8_9AGAR|nr:hypothetical protein F5890DRAFT_1149891 [Lentinula detonsa]